jgi:hypothetical protein
MAGGDVNELHQPFFLISDGVLVNNNGRCYQSGKPYGVDVKLFIAANYLDHKERLNGMQPVVTKVSVECHVGKTFVVKIECELGECTYPCIRRDRSCSL